MPEARPPFPKILVANRGEIAVRILRACRENGIRSVAVYSEADVHAPHVRYADEAVPIGPAPAVESYLNVERILSAARECGVDAIHPGYGFLAESAEFAKACEAAGHTFIGPSAEAMTRMGNKIEARRTMAAAGVPIIPGNAEPVADATAAARIAATIGYPVLIKASAGGGGKGIRVAEDEPALARALANAREEARAAFGDAAVFIEKLLTPVRHIEVQVLADQHGNVVILGERECSIQRRRQKLIEESPAVSITPALRAELEAAAARVVRACDYTSAGTVEFLVYGEEQFAFLELNARLQVEHPVTEMVRGVDLVSDMIRIAAGEPIGYSAADSPPRGWAIECRITAEDPWNDFLPSAGTVYGYREPAGPGIRVESGLAEGLEIGVFYDPLLAKIIAWGSDREQARRRMLRALGEFRVLGLRTSVPFHRAMLSDPRFVRGEINTEYVEREFQMEPPQPPDHGALAALAGAAFLHANGAISPTANGRNGAGGAHNPWRLRTRASRPTVERGWQRRIR